MKTTHKTDGSMALENHQVKVITIEATKKPEAVQLRVAAYARVSSSSEDQLNSFAAQNRYYTDLIANHTGWKLVDIYADEGITGTSIRKRDDFQRMIKDCQRGKIDRILVKSLSRFARNTSDCLTAIRELKALGVTVSFEKEGIDTAKMTGEMLTAIYAAFAQSESESISGNMKWSCQKRMENGTYISGSTPLGYRLDEQALHPDADAELVCLIFHKFLSGESSVKIAQDLNSIGIPSPKRNAYWHASTIRYILSNEKYMGDTLLGKNYRTDTFPYVRRKNRGERTQYYVFGTQEQIISHEDFKRVQALLDHRGAVHKGQERVSYPFSNKVFCKHCGTHFQHKVNRTHIYWVCRNHNISKANCPMEPIPECEIETAFCRLYYKLKRHGKDILLPMLRDYQQIRNRRMLWSEDIIELNKQISDLSSQNQMLTMLKQQGLIDPDIFIAQINDLTEQLRETKLKKERLLDAESNDYLKQTQEQIDLLESGPDFLDAFDADMFGELIEKVEVESQTVLYFYLKNGLALKENIERTGR